MRKTKQLEIPRDLHQRLKDMAREQGRKLYALAAELIAAGMAKKETK